MTCAMDSYLGAYVLDALEPAETEDVRRHLETCEACRDTVRDLGWIPDVLATVPLHSLADAEQPVLLDRLLASAASERRHRVGRRRFVLAAAAFAVAVAGGASLPLFQHSPPVSTVRGTDSGTGVTAEVSMTGRGEGTELGLRLSGVRPGERCSLVARATDGRTETAATWVATYTGTADVSGTTAIARNRLDALEVVTDDGRTLVRLAVPTR